MFSLYIAVWLILRAQGVFGECVKEYGNVSE